MIPKGLLFDKTTLIFYLIHVCEARDCTCILDYNNEYLTVLGISLMSSRNLDT